MEKHVLCIQNGAFSTLSFAVTSCQAFDKGTGFIYGFHCTPMPTNKNPVVFEMKNEGFTRLIQEIPWNLNIYFNNLFLKYFLSF